MLGNRMSSLPYALHCGLAPRLGEEHGAGRAALQSSAYHAIMAGEQTDLWARLTSEEQEEALRWATPTDVDLGGVKLRYADAHKEVELVLSSELDAFQPEDGWKVHAVEDGHLDLMQVSTGEISAVDFMSYASVGHADFVWDPIVDDGMKVVYVGDAKRSAHTADISTLQLDAYGWAWARVTGADAYGAGLWILTEGRWIWRDELVILDDLSSADIARKLSAAIKNGRDSKPAGSHAITGPHCRDCYQRPYCAEHLVPPAALVRAASENEGRSEAMEAFRAFSEPGGLTKDNACDALLLTQAVGDLYESMKKQIQAYADRAGGIHDGAGKVYRKTGSGKPTRRFDQAKFKKEHPDLVDEYMVDGKPRFSYRWCKE